MHDVSTYRLILAVRPFDIGPVTFPAYAGTTAGVRSVDGMAETRYRSGF